MILGDILFFYQEETKPFMFLEIPNELMNKLNELKKEFQNKEEFFEYTENLYLQNHGLSKVKRKANVN